MPKLPWGLLRDASYRNLFSSFVSSAVGTQVVSLAMPLIALQALAATEFEVGVVTAMSTGAFLLVGLPAGALVDRMRLRWVMVTCDLVRAALLLTLPIAWWLDRLTIWHLYVIVLLVGVCSVFFDTATQTSLPTLVARENLVEANSKIGGVQESSRLIGPAVGGQLIGWLTAPVSVLITTVSLLGSAFFLRRLHSLDDRPRSDTDKPTTLRADIMEGLRYVLRHKLLRAMVASSAWSNMWTAAYTAMMLVYLDRDAALSAGGIGLFLSLSGVGGLLGAFLARRCVDWIGSGPVLWVMRVIGAPCYLLLPLFGEGWGVWIGAVGVALASGTLVVINVAQVSNRQLLTTDRLQGRVAATTRFLNWGTLPLGSFIGGVLGGWIGTGATLLVTTILIGLSFVPTVVSPLRSMRTMPAPEPDTPAEQADSGARSAG